MPGQHNIWHCYARGCMDLAAYVVSAAPIMYDGEVGPTVEVVAVCRQHLDVPPWSVSTLTG